MANAMSPGRTAMEAVRPEQNVPKGTSVKEKNGKQYLVTEMTNGNERYQSVFPGDYDSKGKKVKKGS